MSPGPFPEASARSSSLDIAVRDRESSVSLAPSHEIVDDSDSTESSGESASPSEGGNDDDDDGENGREIDATVTLGGPKKPTMNAGVLSGASDLASRLKAFLPQIQQANSELAKRGPGANMEDVDEEEEHIEMSLGLGVLEQKKADDLEDLLRNKSQSRPTDDRQTGSDGEDQASLNRLMNRHDTQQPNIEELESRPDCDNVAGRISTDERANLAIRRSGQR